MRCAPDYRARLLCGFEKKAALQPWNYRIKRDEKSTKSRARVLLSQSCGIDAIYMRLSCCGDDRIVVILGAANAATTRTATATAFRDARILRDATDKNGRYDASKLARLLDWTISDIAQYLGRDASTISRFGASPVHQEKLAALAALTQEVFEIMRQDLRATRAWFRTPIRALDGSSPQQLILTGNCRRVSSLIEESRSGLAS